MIVADKIRWLSDVERSIRRIAVAYRVVAIVWTGVLVLSAVLTDVVIPRLWLVIAAWGLMIAWGVFIVSAHLRNPLILHHPVVLVTDVATAVAALYVPWMAGNTATLEFSAGYPLSSVALVVAVAGRRAGVAAGGTLLVAALARRIFVLQNPTLGNVVSEVMFWLFPTALMAWAAMIIRGFARERRQAEEALAGARAEQARLEERQDLAAHLHDSVLQTLALIQRQPDDPAAVAALARTQERELRAWLYGSGRNPETSMAAAVEAVCAQVEDLHGVAVELVTAGDTAMSEHVVALVGAAREALVNAAKHSKAGSVSVFAEVDGGMARIFVRDRGIGYDPTMVAADRRGVQDSIVGRMRRHGGLAEIRTGPDEGTEVRLQLAVPS